MDITNIISMLASKETISAVTADTKVDGADVKNVLNTVVGMAKEAAPTEGLDLSKLAGTATTLLGAGKADASSLLTSVLGKGSLGDVAKLAKVPEGLVKKILDSAAKLLSSGSEGKDAASAVSGILGKLLK